MLRVTPPPWPLLCAQIMVSSYFSLSLASVLATKLESSMQSYLAGRIVSSHFPYN